MGRSSTAHGRLIQTTSDLLRRRGYGSVGVAEICAHAGVQKGSFYHFFASKEVLAEAAVRDAWAEERERWRNRLRGDAPPLDRLKALFDDQVAAQRDLHRVKGAVLGCMFGNLALELATSDDQLRAAVQEVFDEQTEMVRAVLLDAAARGDIPASSAGIATARALIAQLEGMLLFARLHNRPRLLDGLWPHMCGLLGVA